MEEFACDETSRGIELYAGEFLSEFSIKDAEVFEEWVIWQREFFRELYITRLKKLIAALLREKRATEAVHYLNVCSVPTSTTRLPAAR